MGSKEEEDRKSGRTVTGTRERERKRMFNNAWWGGRECARDAVAGRVLTTKVSCTKRERR